MIIGMLLAALCMQKPAMWWPGRSVDDDTDGIKHQSSCKDRLQRSVMAKKGLVTATSAYSPMTLIWGRVSKRKKLNIRSNKLGLHSGRWMWTQFFSPQISKMLKSMLLMLLRLLPAIWTMLVMLRLTWTSQLHLQHPPSTLNSSTTRTTTTFDALLRQLPGAYNRCYHHWNKPPNRWPNITTASIGPASVGKPWGTMV